MTDRTAKIWVRAPRPGVYRCVVRLAGRRPPLPGSPFETRATARGGRTATFEIPLPRAGAEYAYDVQNVRGESILPGDVPAPTFVNAPADDTTGDLSFALFSCNNLTAYTAPRKRRLMWERLAEVVETENVRFLLGVGDQVYADDVWKRLMRRRTLDRDEAVAEYRSVYELHWSDPGPRRLMATCPTYMIWDDHEIMNGWGSHDSDAVHPRRRLLFEAARRAYREFQHAHNPWSFGRNDLHYAFRFGDVGVVVLDLRGRRDITRRADPLLGPRQWSQVEGWLATHAAQLRALFVVVSVPLVHIRRKYAEYAGVFTSDLRDQWTYPPNVPEASRVLRSLFDLANAHRVRVVILGGDVHVGTLAAIRSRATEHEGHPLIYQLTSSPISSRPLTGLPGRFVRGMMNGPIEIEGGFTGRILKHVDRRNFGIVRLQRDERSDAYRVRLSLHAEGPGEPFHFAIP